MKADEDVRMISTEAPVVFAKVCEIFIHTEVMDAHRGEQAPHLAEE
jgi:hypothetical protein